MTPLLGRRSAPGQGTIGTYCADKQHQLRSCSIGDYKDDQSQATNVRGTANLENLAQDSTEMGEFLGLQGTGRENCDTAENSAELLYKEITLPEEV